MEGSVSHVIKDAKYAQVRHIRSAFSAPSNISYWKILQIVSAAKNSRMACSMMRKNRDAMKSVGTGETMGDINAMMGTQPIEMDVQGTAKQRRAGTAAKALILQKTFAYILLRHDTVQRLRTTAIPLRYIFRSTYNSTPVYLLARCSSCG